MSLKDVLIADLIANKLLTANRRAGWLTIIRKTAWAVVYHPRYMCTFWYRINRWLYLKGLPGADFLSARRIYWFGNDISYYAEIGPGLRLVHLSDVVMGGNVRIGDRATILNGVTLGSKRRGENDDMPLVGDDVYIGSGTKIIGGVRIGNNVTVGALTLCNKDVPDNHLFYGIPPHHVSIPKTKQ